MYSFILLGLLQVSSTVLVEDTRLPWNTDIEYLNSQDILVIKGKNFSTLPQTLVVRIDDKSSNDYYSRTNLERKVAPGLFEIRVPVQGLKKENKLSLNVDDLRRIFVFNATEIHRDNKWPKLLNSNDRVTVSSISLDKNREFPSFIRIYDFGNSESQVLEGAQGVSLKHHRSKGDIKLFGQMTSVNRPGPDPWIKDGIYGIEEVRIPLEAGLWRLTLFREDLGEWENLPRQLNLGVAINGVERDGKNNPYTHNPAFKWYQQEYLKFYKTRADRGPWEDIVRHRGLVQSFDFEQGSEELSIRLLGDTPQQRFISGIILQPLDHRVYNSDYNGLSLINERRREYFKKSWLVENKIIETEGSNKVDSLRLAKGEGRLVEFTAEFDRNVTISSDSAFERSGGYLEFRQSLPRWRREGSEQHIKKSFNHLSVVKERKFIKGRYKLLLWLQAGLQQTEGHYKTLLSFKDSNQNVLKDVSIDIEVINQTLPENKQKVGIYLDHSPHLTFFKQWNDFQLAQVYCDLRYLDQLDLMALAPPFDTPTEDNLLRWNQEISLYQKFYGQQNLLAYTPYKRLRKLMDDRALKKKIKSLTAHKSQNSLLYWSIADETRDKDKVKKDADLLHSANQFAKTAGHLNDKSQTGLIDKLDLILMNHGFGVSRAVIDGIHGTLIAKGEKAKQVWLYNMPKFRLAAGAFLWRSNADGYVQWHGRMPTANPYDPTDGREGDYQLFYPQPTACTTIPDVDRGLFELSMGQFELRWYLWLDQQRDDRALKLKEQIKSVLGSSWSEATMIEIEQLEQWRDQIIDLAQSLKQPNKDTKLLGVGNEARSDFHDNEQAYKTTTHMGWDCTTGGMFISSGERC